MKRAFKMAWRNLWRNKRRTAITVGSIFFAVFFSILMRSLQLGIYNGMVEQSVESFSGYLQLQQLDYYDEPSLDNAFVYDQSIKMLLKNNPDVKVAVPRIESFSLASNGPNTKGVLVSAIDPRQEKRMSDPEKHLLRFQLNGDVISAIRASELLTPKQDALLEAGRDLRFKSLKLVAYQLALKSGQQQPIFELVKQFGTLPSNYLTEKDQGVLLGGRLSNFLKAKVGDTLVLMGQGFHGATAAALFPVRGIVDIPSLEIDNKLVYMTLSAAQNYFGMDQQVTTVCINLNDNKKMVEVQTALSEALSTDDIVVKNWEQFNPTLKQTIQSDDVGGQIFLGILYFIVFFGIFGTVLMMIAERKKEFGVMIAIGMRKRKLQQILVVELFLLGALGAFLGMLINVPIIAYFSQNPIPITGSTAQLYEQYGIQAELAFAGFEGYFLVQGAVVLLMVSLAAISPVRTIKKLTVIDAMRR